jgi:hypothetical protein
MPRKISLRGFLRQEILRKRIRTTSDTHSDIPSSAPLIRPLTQEGKTHQLEDFDSLFDEPMTRVSECIPSNNLRSFFDEPVARGDQSKKIEKLDSLFGEAIKPIATKEEVIQSRLQELLAQTVSEKAKHFPPTIPQNPDLDAMKNELENLVVLEADAHLDKRVLVRSRKSALIREIRAAERDEDERQRRGMWVFYFFSLKVGLTKPTTLQQNLEQTSTNYPLPLK